MDARGVYHSHRPLDLCPRGLTGEGMGLALLSAMALAVCPPGPRSHCVHDGDTVWLSGEKIRIADIDTPELNGRCTSESDLAVASRDRLLNLLY